MKGMELSINFLVMLILAVVVFGFGIKFVYDIAGLGQETVKTLTDQQQRELENALNEGKRVAISLNNKPAYPGQSVVYGLGIMNIESDDKVFGVRLTFGGAVQRDGKTEISGGDTKIKFFTGIDQIIKGNSDAKIPILVKVQGDAPAGTYQVIVSVYKCDLAPGVTTCNAAPSESNLYFQKQTIYVTVS